MGRSPKLAGFRPSILHAVSGTSALLTIVSSVYLRRFDGNTPKISAAVAILIVAGYVLAERFVARVSVGKFHLNFAVSEIPLLAGAFLLPPLAHIVLRFAATFLGSMWRIRHRSDGSRWTAILVNAWLGAADVTTFVTTLSVLRWNRSLNGGDLMRIVVAWTFLSLSFHAMLWLGGRLSGARPEQNMRGILKGIYLSFVTMSWVIVGAMAVSHQTRFLFPVVIVLIVSIATPARFVIGLLVKGEQYRSLDQFFTLLQSANTDTVGTALNFVSSAAKSRSAKLLLLEREGVDCQLETALTIDVNGHHPTLLSEIPTSWLRSIRSGEVSIRGDKKPQDSSAIDPTLSRTEIVCPLIVSGKTIGLLICIDQLDEARRINAADVAMATLLAQNLSLWLEQDRLVTELRREMLQRTAEALHDPLTGILNRRGFNEEWNRFVTQGHEHIALLLIDLDRFKDVNSYAGHEGGDQVLQEVADRLKETIPPRAVVARLGGDEFAVLVPGVREASMSSGSTSTGVLGAAEIGVSIRRTLSTPHTVNGEEMLVGGTVGVALWPDHGADVGELLGNADSSLFVAKDDSDTGVAVFSVPRFGPDTQVIDGYRLKAALDHGDIEVVYQPIIDMSTYRVAGFEALARWNDGPNVIMPTQFIPLAEKSGHIHELTKFVISKAFVEVVRWSSAYAKDLHIGVNFSPVCIANPHSLHALTDALLSTGLDPAQVFIEVTESRMFRNPERAVAHLDAMKRLGVRISLDDFGTGASTYEWLMRMAPHQLKVDRMFVRDIEDPRAAGILEVDAFLARKFDMSLVAEGIETVAQWQRAKELGMTYGQGFLTGHPMPSREVDRWLLQTEPNLRALIDSADSSIEPDNAFVLQS